MPSQTVTLTASTESHVTATEFYSTIVIYNAGSGNVTVQCDGTVLASATSNGSFTIAAGSQQVFYNGQALPQGNETFAGAWNAGVAKFNSGSMDTGGAAAPTNPCAKSAQRNQSQASSWSAQGLSASSGGWFDSNGTPTYVSLYSAGTPTVTVELQ
jgi:hypothetical protein